MPRQHSQGERVVIAAVAVPCGHGRYEAHQLACGRKRAQNVAADVRQVDEEPLWIRLAFSISKHLLLELDTRLKLFQSFTGSDGVLRKAKRSRHWKKPTAEGQKEPNSQNCF